MSRKVRRETNRLEIKLREKLVPLTEAFVSKYLEHSVAGTSDKMDSIFEKLNDHWKAFCINIINKNPNIYSNPKKRDTLIQAFSNFVVNMYDKVNQPLDKN